MNAERLPTRRGIALLLPDHHRRLEAKCQDLLARAHENDLRDVVAGWAAFERELLEHMAAEEEVVIPSYARHAPADARRILDEHARLRAIVSAMGVDVELHEIRVARLTRLLDALETHADHEDAVMYPWAEENLVEVAQHVLVDRIRRWL